MTWLHNFFKRLLTKRPDLDLPRVGPRPYPTVELAALGGILEALRLEPGREVAGIVTRCRDCEPAARFRYRLVAVGGVGRVTYDLPGEAVAHFHTHPDSDPRHGRADRRIVKYVDPYHRPSYVGNGVRFFRYAPEVDAGTVLYREREIDGLGPVQEANDDR